MDAPVSTPLDARAWYVGARIDVRALERTRAPLATTPLILAAGDPGDARASGRLVVFRFGVVVCFGLAESLEHEALAGLRGFIAQPVAPQLAEDVDVVVEPEGEERVTPNGLVQLRASDDARLSVMAEVLAKSALLAHHEQEVAAAFDGVEELAESLGRGSWSRRTREMQAEIGRALAVQVRTVGRAEVSDKPDLIWDDPELDRLYVRLADEFELRDRDRALTRKLELVAGTAQTYVELVHSRQGLRLEWAIVLLIVFEIVITLWELWGH